uniref:Uncharacterized protein n=1 Tax=Tanacetum cinerariifolium TaxID=118510 RepID=A0A6L2KUI3_TANCI|nr:hypothetical protein [Tanacetum cinerariifolium]
MQIATKLNRLRKELLVLCEKKRNIARELIIFRSIVVVSKAAEFVAESVRKANDQAVQVREVETHIEATVPEKEGCIQKIVGNASDKMHDYCRLSDELRKGVRKRDAYIEELRKLQMFNNLDRVRESVDMIKSMQTDDMQKASRLLLMVREVKNEVSLLRDPFAKGGLDSVVDAMTEVSSFVGCGSEERRGMVDVIVSATVSMTSVGGVPVEECVPELANIRDNGLTAYEGHSAANCVSAALSLLADWLSGESKVVANLSPALCRDNYIEVFDVTYIVYAFSASVFASPEGKISPIERMHPRVNPFSPTRLWLLEVPDMPDSSNTLLVHAGNPHPYHWLIIRVLDPTDEKIKMRGGLD